MTEKIHKGDTPEVGTRVEVRCCCDAGKLLGTIPFMGPSLRFTRLIPLDLRVTSYHVDEPSPHVMDRVNYGEITWAEGRFVAHGPLYWAYKSNDFPLEELQRLPGWADA